jgi:hypothetical protein
MVGIEMLDYQNSIPSDIKIARQGAINDLFRSCLKMAGVSVERHKCLMEYNTQYMELYNKSEKTMRDCSLLLMILLTDTQKEELRDRIIFHD